jgi:hypothetical protein
MIANFPPFSRTISKHFVFESVFTIIIVSLAVLYRAFYRAGALALTDLALISGVMNNVLALWNFYHVKSLSVESFQTAPFNIIFPCSIVVLTTVSGLFISVQRYEVSLVMFTAACTYTHCYVYFIWLKSQLNQHIEINV